MKKYCLMLSIIVMAIMFSILMVNESSTKNNMYDEEGSFFHVEKNTGEAYVYYATGLPQDIQEAVIYRTYQFADNLEFVENDSQTWIMEVNFIEEKVMSALFKQVEDNQVINIQSVAWQPGSSQIFKDVIAEDLLFKLSADVRYALQPLESMNELGYTLDFYNQTDFEHLKESPFLIDHDNITFYFASNQFGIHEAFEIVYPLHEVVSYLSIDTGITQVESSLIHQINRYIDPQRPVIAFTFDDGPRLGTSDDIEEILMKYGQSATFFVLGQKIEGKEDIIIDMINHGHEIATHSHTHKNFNSISDETLAFEVNEPVRLIEELTGYEYSPTSIRAPYGASNDHVKSQVQYPFILWSVDTLDWRYRNANVVTQHVLAHVSDGDIVLMHDLYESTQMAVERLVPELIEQGYQIVSVSQLAKHRGATLESGQVYRSFEVQP